MLRRHFNLGLSCLVLAGCLHINPSYIKPSSRGPKFWRAERGLDSSIYLLGAAEAKDRSWLTPHIERAFAASSELWLETPLDPWPPALLQELGHNRERTFLESLEPSVRERTKIYVSELGIDPRGIESMRPWYAYYRINSAFWKQHTRPPGMESPEAILRGMAVQTGKTVQHEFQNGETLLRYFAAMPIAAQSQYIEMLLDFFDDEKRSLNEAYFGWVTGVPSTRALDRMRTKTPELYKFLQADRNVWWAQRIEQMLATSGTRFVLLGMNHVLGPQGVPKELQRIGVELVDLSNN
jgi:uncharacterized protein YbaP (TraB family)